MYTLEMLQEARKALHQLLLGQQVVSVSKNGRQVQFNQASISGLRNYIIEIETGLGIKSGRRPPAGVKL